MRRGAVATNENNEKKERRERRRRRQRGNSGNEEERDNVVRNEDANSQVSMFAA